MPMRAIGSTPRPSRATKKRSLWTPISTPCSTAWLSPTSGWANRPRRCPTWSATRPSIRTTPSPSIRSPRCSCSRAGSTMPPPSTRRSWRPSPTSPCLGAVWPMSMLSRKDTRRPWAASTRWSPELRPTRSSVTGIWLRAFLRDFLGQWDRALAEFLDLKAAVRKARRRILPHGHELDARVRPPRPA